LLRTFYASPPFDAIEFLVKPSSNFGHGGGLSPKTEGDVVAVADIPGDWREEMINALLSS
jgi:hypothetical protein